jgi:hypothetical protein
VDPDLATLIMTLPAGLLPPGRLMPRENGKIRYWLSDQPAEPDLWIRVRAEHPRSGLWPLGLSGLTSEPDRPWVSGEVYAQQTEPRADDVEAVLAQFWAGRTADEDAEEDPEDEAERVATFAPYSTWPGLAPRGDLQGSPEDFADQYAQIILDGSARLGLVAAARGSDALTTSGWSGPVNHTKTARVSTVVRSWEDRFGVRVVGAGFDTLALSVAAPPRSLDQSLPIAAEHFAFCPDSFQYGEGALVEYAEGLVGVNSWQFWWD